MGEIVEIGADSESEEELELPQLCEYEDDDNVVKLVSSESSSASDSKFISDVELSADEKHEQADVFRFLEGLTDDEVSFINKRFGGFTSKPLNLFESCF